MVDRHHYRIDTVMEMDTLLEKLMSAMHGVNLQELFDRLVREEGNCTCE